MKAERGEPRFKRGDRVVVNEANIRPYAGLVGAVKWSKTSETYRVEVRCDDDGLTRSVVEDIVRAES